MSLQTFEVRGGPGFGRRNVPRLRQTLAKRGLDGLIIPHEDEYQNEYVPPALDRLLWATGFTGSAGAAVVMADRAAMFVDGRYTLQVRAQVDNDLFQYEDLVEPGLAAWLADNLRAGERLGYDPRLHTPDGLARLNASAERAGAVLVPVDPNPIDTAWSDRPSLSKTPFTAHPAQYAGEDSASKRARLADDLTQAKHAAAVITAPPSIAWLLNIRGSDVACTPLALGSAILYADGRAVFYTDLDKVDADLRAHLGPDVSVRAETEFGDALEALSGAVSLDPQLCSAWAFDRVAAGSAEIVRAPDPCALPRARKNPVEAEGAREAHRRDGAALAAFLYWLSHEAPKGGLDEIQVALKLEACRQATGALQDISFESISGAGPNGAIVHYRVNAETNRALQPGGLFLIDSGAQYLDGTTDVTRTLAIGDPSAEMRERYTLVLKGHIALASVRFPPGIGGINLDALARAPLWAAGFDYDHGTGHGVGSYLGVHEGPQRIAKRQSDVALEPGMIVSNEPGYYKSGAYGIRIENLQIVTEAEAVPGGERAMLGFETLTLAPFDRSLIDADALSPAERAWVDAYHARVLAEVGPRVDPEVRKWLETACAAL
ncbi:MAG: aminopeptidase P family protein [Maricaulaceae bacterium]